MLTVFTHVTNPVINLIMWQVMNEERRTELLLRHNRTYSWSSGTDISL